LAVYLYFKFLQLRTYSLFHRFRTVRKQFSSYLSLFWIKNFFGGSFLEKIFAKSLLIFWEQNFSCCQTTSGSTNLFWRGMYQEGPKFSQTYRDFCEGFFFSTKGIQSLSLKKFKNIYSFNLQKFYHQKSCENQNKIQFSVTADQTKNILLNILLYQLKFLH